MELFTEISLVVIVAAVIAAVMRLLKQPLIVGYILAGIVVGPYGLDTLHSVEQVELFSKIGIAILLFIVGLHLSPSVIKEVGRVSVVTGIGQVVFTSIIGFGIALLLGIPPVASVYIAIALTFSSTIIILKLLSDRGDLEKLYGKIAVGFLLVQDIVAMFILLFIPVFAEDATVSIWLVSSFLFVKMLILFCSLYLIQVYVLRPVMRAVARSQELLFLFSIAWGLGLASLFQIAGFSVEIGALVAGVMLSVTPYAYEIGSRLKPLRDFFIVVFFIFLGSQMVLDQFWSLLPATIILSLFVLIGNPIIVILLMNVLGFKKKTGFMAGLTVAQISEFSLILVSLGYEFGHVSQEIMSLAMMVGLITIAGSTYFILYADELYARTQGLLDFFQIIKSQHREKKEHVASYDALLFGYDRVGGEFIRSLKRIKASYIVIDFNPQSISRLKSLHIPHRFGDASDVEFLNELPIKSARIVLSTIPDHHVNVLLARSIRVINPRMIVIMIASDMYKARELYREGVTYVVMPHYLGAQHTAHMIQEHELIKRDYRKEAARHQDYINRQIEQMKQEKRLLNTHA